jgi:transcriptional regulator of heat shock response
MTERTREILTAAVDYHVKTGEPITSANLYEKYDFGIKPAMIRWELNELTEDGYLYQNHPSGGRFPTNAAYKFFAELSLSRASNQVRGLDNYRSAVKAGEMQSLLNMVSEELKVMALGYDENNKHAYRTPFHNFLENLEASQAVDVVSAIEECERLADELSTKDFFGVNGDLQIFIGRSPILRSDNLSLIASRVATSQGEWSLFLIGPKRMDYDKPIRIFKQLKRI